jgi:hypothetical protein
MKSILPIPAPQALGIAHAAIAWNRTSARA